jgi:hypothetical protein
MADLDGSCRVAVPGLGLIPPVGMYADSSEPAFLVGQSVVG